MSSKPRPGLLSQNLHLTKIPGDLCAESSLRSTTLGDGSERGDLLSLLPALRSRVLQHSLTSRERDSGGCSGWVTEGACPEKRGGEKLGMRSPNPIFQPPGFPSHHRTEGFSASALVALRAPSFLLCVGLARARDDAWLHPWSLPTRCQWQPCPWLWQPRCLRMLPGCVCVRGKSPLSCARIVQQRALRFTKHGQRDHTFLVSFSLRLVGGGMPRVRQGQGEESKAWGQALLCWVAGEECPPTFKQKAPVWGEGGHLPF